MLIPTAVFAWIVCVLLQGGVFTPLVRARGLHCVTALLILLASSSLTTLTIQLASGSLDTATFSLPAFYSGLLLAFSALLLAPSILFLGLSSVLLISLLSSFLSTCLLYFYASVPLLGFEYDADGALHFSAFVLTTLVGACGIGCLLVAVAGRLTSEEEEWTSKESEARVSRAVLSSEDSYVDIDSLEAEEERPSERYSLNHQLTSSHSTASSTFSSSALCWPFSTSIPSALAAALSPRHFSRASVRLGVGFVTCALSALLYCVHLLPIYATQRDGILRMLSLDPYLLSIQLGLLLVTCTVCPFVLYTARTLTRHRQSVLLSPLLTGGCCLGGAVAGAVYWWTLGYMPAHAHIDKDSLVSEYEWYFYSIATDALVVAAQSVPRFTLTALAWAVAKEHRVPIPTKALQEQRVTRAVLDNTNSELLDDRGDVEVVEREETLKTADSRVSWSTVSLWCLALVLGAVSDGVAAFAWDEGY